MVVRSARWQRSLCNLITRLHSHLDCRVVALDKKTGQRCLRFDSMNFNDIFETKQTPIGISCTITCPNFLSKALPYAAPDLHCSGKNEASLTVCLTVCLSHSLELAASRNGPQHSSLQTCSVSACCQSLSLG